MQVGNWLRCNGSIGVITSKLVCAVYEASDVWWVSKLLSMAWAATQAAWLLCAVLWHMGVLLLYMPCLAIRRIWRHRTGNKCLQDWTTATFWEGSVQHARLQPVKHAFRCAACCKLVCACSTSDCSAEPPATISRNQTAGIGSDSCQE